MIRKIIGLYLLCLLAGPLAAAPIIEIDFNNVAGDQSLENRGTISTSGSFDGNAVFTSDAAPPNTGGWAGSFDGSTGGAQFENYDQLEGLNDLTITAWINVDNDSFSRTRRIVDGADVPDIGNTQDRVDNTFGFELLFRSDEKISFRRNGGTEAATGDVKAADGWKFIAAAFSGGQFVDFYIGDAGSVLPAGSADFGNSEPLGESTDTTDPLMIGRTDSDFFINRGEERVFPGLIDNVRIYDSALTQNDLNTVSQFNDVPEPGCAVLLLLAALTFLRRRKRGPAEGR